MIQKAPKTTRRLNQKPSKINCSATLKKPSRQNLINISRRKQHQGQQEITPTITGGGLPRRQGHP
jgi:hypothetical protein